MTTTRVADNAYTVALENFDAAANVLGLNNDIREVIKYPERILTVSVPVRMEDDRLAAVEATRARVGRLSMAIRKM